MYNVDPKTRIERNVFYSPDGCWYWLGSTNGTYGHIMINGKIGTAHRASYSIYKGDPKEFHVLHSCDNTLCVNPDHLFLGTHAENMKDRDDKGRVGRGERHGHSKLTSAQVIAIRDAALHGLTHLSIANYFKMKRESIRDIVKRKNWSWL